MLKSIAGALVLSMLWVGTAAGETRSLKLLNLHTKERSEVVYKINGRYSPEGLQRINHVLRDWRKNEAVTINPRLLDVIWQTYRASGASGWIEVICGYRSPATNSMLRSRSSGVAKESQHTRGNALDFHIQGVPLSRVREIGLKMQAGGVGFYPSSGSPFVHFDVGNVRHWPRMSRQQLAAVFPDGRTVHVPADGRPLPGYQEAQAALRQRGGAPVQMAMAEEENEGAPGFFSRLFGAPQREVRQDAPAPRQVAAARPQVPPTAIAAEMPERFDVAAIRPVAPAPVPVATPVETASATEPLALARVPIPVSAPREIAVAAVNDDIPVPNVAPTRPTREQTVLALQAPARPKQTVSSSQVALSALAFQGPSEESFDVILGEADRDVKPADALSDRPLAADEAFVAARIASAFDGTPFPAALVRPGEEARVQANLDGEDTVSKGSRPSARSGRVTR